jgi:hypothetical protein
MKKQYLAVLATLSLIVFALVHICFRDPAVATRNQARQGPLPSNPPAQPTAADTVLTTPVQSDEVSIKDPAVLALAESSTPPDLGKITAFDAWSKRWAGASATERDGMKAEGLQRATERRPEFKKLIKTDPRQALEMATPQVIRQDLPEEVQAQLEQPVSATGDYNVYLGKPEPGVELPPDAELALRYFETGGKSYRARVYGKMEPVMTRKNVPLRGVAIDRELAVPESPVRQLEKGRARGGWDARRPNLPGLGPHDGGKH